MRAVLRAVDYPHEREFDGVVYSETYDFYLREVNALYCISDTFYALAEYYIAKGDHEKAKGLVESGHKMTDLFLERLSVWEQGILKKKQQAKRKERIMRIFRIFKKEKTDG